MTTIEEAQDMARYKAARADFDVKKDFTGYGFCMKYADLDALIADLLTTHSLSILKALEERLRDVAIFETNDINWMPVTAISLDTALTIAKELLEPKNSI